MQIDFVLKNTHVTGGEIKEFLDDKTGKLKKYYDGRMNAKWTISYEKEEHVAHLHVTGAAGDYFGETRLHNLFSAIEETIDKVERQILKHKDIQKNHRV